jgi:hypothetical protein
MMGTMMDKSSCEWVRGRLPLCMGLGDDASDPGGDGDDLSALDRRSIEAHLGACPACRQHRSGLARALEALDLAAVSPPVVPDAPSLWPALEQRIAAHQSRDPSRTSRVRECSAEGTRIWAALDDDRLLRSAWMQDTLREVVEAAGLGARFDRSRGGRSGHSPRAAGGRWRIVGASLAASILALLIVVPVTWRLRATAEARIAGNAAPLPLLAEPMNPPAPEWRDLPEPDPSDDRDIPPGQLAQAEPIKPPTDPSSVADAAAGAKSGVRPRVGVLENLTPMPLDGRDDKPAY